MERFSCASATSSRGLGICPAFTRLALRVLDRSADRPGRRCGAGCVAVADLAEIGQPNGARVAVAMYEAIPRPCARAM